MKPVLCYPGSKRLMAPKLLPLIPPHAKYVEPFFGGGSVFFAKPRSKKEVISDFNRPLMRMYRSLDCSALQRCQSRLSSTPASQRAKVVKRMAERARNGSSSTCDQVMGRSLSYLCALGGYLKTGELSKSSPMKNKVRQCRSVKERLRGVKIGSGDFRKTIRENDSSSTFFFLDPPYSKVINKGYASNSVTPQEVCSFLRGVRGKFMLTYDDSKEVRRACRGFRVKKIRSKYIYQKALGKGGKDVDGKQLLITNYPLPRG